MHNKREKVVSYIISVLAVATFVVVTFYALVWASGIKYDAKTGKIIETSVISIQTNLSNVTVLMNGETIGTETPLDERSLEPGRYRITISKPGFVVLDKTFNLAADQVGIITSSVTLLAQNPTIERNISGLVYHAHDPYDVGLNVTQGEILDNAHLVTRLSANASQVHRFNQSYVYQLNDQIRLYIPETNQDALVYTLNNTNVAKLSLDASNWQVSVFNSNNAADVVHLIEPNATSASSQ